ncbi:MAG: cation:proton antiporter [Deltaproteobacteria bacterium]
MSLESVIVLLFVAATAVAIVARRVRLPYTVALVVAGLVLGALHALEPPHLTQQLLFTVFLPGLIFEAAFHLDLGGFRRDAAAIVSLALPGVLAGMLLTAVILQPAANFLQLTQAVTWHHALVFGALMAATDPIAVVGLFRSVGAPRRLATLLEAESLLNDGTSIVLFGVVLGYVTGNALSGSDVVTGFATVVGLGAGVGFLVGLVVSKTIQNLDDPMIEITLTTIAAYGAFVAAQRLQGSGVIATVVAGMVCGAGAREGMTPTTRVAVETFWEYIAFALNSMVFLLIGFEVKLDRLLGSWQLVLAAYAAVLAARAGVVFAVSGLLSRTAGRIPASWSAILSWGGLRGGLSMVLALSLPRTFPNRDLLIATTFGVVIVSILVQGLTMAPLLHALGVVRPGVGLADYELNRGRLKAAQTVLTELDALSRRGALEEPVVDSLREEYRARLAEAEENLRALHAERADLRGDELRLARRRLLMTEREQALDAYREGALGREAYDRLLGDVDQRLLALDAGEDGPKA